MAKKFNITGTCIPSRHFMADTSEKLRQILKLVEAGAYFTINRPRQYGKTTTLSLLVPTFSQAGFLAVRMSFEGLGESAFENERVFIKQFLALVAEKMADDAPDLSAWLEGEKPETMHELSKTIAQLVKKSPRKIVLMIDEVDKSSNNQLFLNFLGLLRQKFLDAAEDRDHTFHSVILAGVHDVKTLKLKLRPGEEQKFNSPWNIASDFTVEMSLLPHEIVPMLEDFARERGVSVDAPKIANVLFFHTSGYPFLVSKLCKIFDETLLPKKSERVWTEEDIQTAVNLLLIEDNTNFDSLTKNLANNPDLEQLVFNVMMFGRDFSGYNFQDPLIKLGILYGIFRNGATLRIHNRIYETLIVGYMTSVLQHRKIDFRGANFSDKYLARDGSLNMDLLLEEFQKFMREEHSRHDQDFLERNGRMVFLAFLKPILNGRGWFFKEPQISEERRLDIIITFFQKKYLVELKIWRGEKAHRTGIEQLADYLETQNLERGYLVVFDHRTDKTWERKRIRKAGKKILAIWV